MERIADGNTMGGGGQGIFQRWGWAGEFLAMSERLRGDRTSAEGLLQ